MSSMVRFDLTVPVSANTVNGWLRLVPGRSPDSLQRIGSYFQGIAGGPFAGSCLVTTGAVQATGSLTITSTGPVATETFSVANVTFTAETSGATGNQFNINASPTIVASNIATAVNASPDTAGLVTATSTLGVVTFTAVVPGTVGNGLQLSESMTNTTASAFAGGVDGTNVTVFNGY